MRRLFSPFVLALGALLGSAYAYLAWRLAPHPAAALALAVPFALVWAVPVVYWVYERDAHGRADTLLHVAGYLSMAWLSFVVPLSLARDLLLGLAAALPAPALQAVLQRDGAAAVTGLALAALVFGMLVARRGPHLRRIDIPIEDLPAPWDGLRIVQISDLHVGPTIGRGYVQRVVAMSNALAPDLVALTGDIVDGPVARLADAVAPLAQLRARDGRFLALGNHDYYAGAAAWTAHFESLGLQVLRNEARVLERGGVRLVVGGVVDPAAAHERPPVRPDPALAAAPESGPALRVLLSHHPKLAPQAEQAGFDLQLSGHTHAGQFFPWTLAVRLVHGPHAAGLSRRGRLWVHVSAGTGTWGPPVRLGTRPELTLLRLVHVPRASSVHGGRQGS